MLFTEHSQNFEYRRKTANTYKVFQRKLVSAQRDSRNGHNTAAGAARARASRYDAQAR